MDAQFKLMNERRKEGKLCDFTIIVEGEKLPVHRLVLDTASEYFRCMFSSEMKEKNDQSCEAKGFTPNGVKRAINFMYGEDIVLDIDCVVDVLQVCDMWQLEKGVAACKDFLAENANEDQCVLFRRLATVYDIPALAEKCNGLIIRSASRLVNENEICELSKDDVIDILRTFRRTGEFVQNPRDMWRFCRTWSRSKGKDEEEFSMCEVIQNFPVGNFDWINFRNLVWQDLHVTECSLCKVYSSHEMLDAGTRVTLSIQNCLFVKRLAKRYKHTMEGVVDEYIITRHRVLFTHPDFVKVDEEDLRRYVEAIDKECSPEQFSGLIAWMKQSPERQEAFPRIFHEDSDWSAETKFLTTIRCLNSSLGWLPNESDIHFIKSLAEQYECYNVLAALNIYVAVHFTHFSKSDMFTSLSAEDVTKYISLAEGCPEEEIWIAATRWIEHDKENRAQHFPDLMEALHLENLSSDFLHETVCKYPLVRDCNSCKNIVIFSQLRKMEKSMDRLTTRVEKLESRS